jgi:hypothetical protein
MTFEGESNGAQKDLLEQFEGVSDRFKSDTRNYLKVHLIDEYETPAQAVIYNVLQNAVDNRAHGAQLEVRIAVDSHSKRLTVDLQGTTGIRDWDRYNSLHFEGAKGIQRRGEGAKILVPISRSVRTETQLLDGTYRQSIWKDDHIWRSDNPAHSELLSHFPPSSLAPGSTRIVAEGLFDEVGDRLAGLDLANPRMAERIVRQDWFLLLEDPSVRLVYEIDGAAQTFTPSTPVVADELILKDVPVLDAGGDEVGRFDRVVLRLTRAPLRGDLSAAIAICTDLHAVSYYQLFGGPNASKLYGYAIAPFLASSETTNHFSFKSTRQWRLAKVSLTRVVNQFMEKHAGVEPFEDPRLRRGLAEVTAQINRIIRNLFPDWHPEGGFAERHETPKEGHDDPWISRPTISDERFDPGASCTLAFDAMGADRGSKRQVEARVAVASSKSALYRKTWPVELDPQERRSISDTFVIAEDTPEDVYVVRFSVGDPKKGVVYDRRVYFKVGNPEERPPRARTPRKTKPRKEGELALNEARVGLFPEEEGRVRESLFRPDPPDGPYVSLNRRAPQYLVNEEDDSAWRYHVARCQIDELAALRFERELRLKADSELGPDSMSLLFRDVTLERSTFLAEWAREELARRRSKAEPVASQPHQATK